MSLLTSVKHLNQIKKMKPRMQIMVDFINTLEAHNYDKEVNNSIIIHKSPINFHLSPMQCSPYLLPTSSEDSQYSQSSYTSIQNQAPQPELQHFKHDLYKFKYLCILTYI